MGDNALVLPLDAPTDLATVGGKGASLAKLARAGLPVPQGFHITTHAFHLGLTPEVTEAIERAYGTMGAVAVRSSATAEDLPDLSFAGQQDSFLNVRGADKVLEAVRKCWASLDNERARKYRERNGITEAHMAVVVQALVPADAAGVLFTANPVTGARDETVINAGWGLGESIVGGHVTPDTYVVHKNKTTQEISDKTVMTVRTADGTQEVPVPQDKRRAPVLTKAQTTELAAVGQRIQDLYGTPMDIEWTLHNGRFAIVQARPITGLREEWNDSRTGDFLWTSVNLGEAVPSVMTPMTWSLVRTLSQQVSIKGFPVTGNIGGRFYLNLSVSAAISPSNEELTGRIPDGVTVPRLPVSKVGVLGSLLRSAPPLVKQAIAYRKHRLEAETPQRCQDLIRRINETTTTQQLAELWRSDVDDLLHTTSRTLDAGARTVAPPKKLRKLVGREDADILLTGTTDLASLGPLVGLSQLKAGKIDRDTYLRTWGHRCPDEFEVSAPRPAEDPDWVDRQLAAFKEPEELLGRQQKLRDEVWERLRTQRIGKLLEKARTTARNREKARSEMVRTFWVFRAFLLRAQELTRNDDLFFLTIDELVATMNGTAKPDTTSRRNAYERYRKLPVYPTFIRGHFDPESWANDPNRRADVYDETRVHVATDEIRGFPGMAGVVEGTARVVSTVEEADQLRPGEILVTTVTNIGWTPLFPRAAAVVTDVGAPLSHAAIVARELGIPAVVGCGNATTRLSTGDRIRVDGAKGTVTPLDDRMLK